MTVAQDAADKPSWLLIFAPLWTFLVFFLLCYAYIELFVDSDGRDNSYAPTLIGSTAYLVLNLFVAFRCLPRGYAASHISTSVVFGLATATFYLYLLMFLLLNTKGS